MNDSDLNSKLKAVRAPERSQEYWEEFPQRVMAELRSAPVEQPVRVFMPGLLWAGRMALACLMAGFCLWQSGMPREVSRALRHDERELRQSVERIHDNLDTLMQDEHGLHQLIADQP